MSAAATPPRAARGRTAAALVLVLALAPAAARSAGAAEGPPRVAGVELRIPDADAAAATELLALAPGDPLTRRALRTTVQRLWLTGRYRNVIVRSFPAAPPPGESGDWVRLEIEGLPLRRVERLEVRVPRGTRLDAEALRVAARIAPGDPFDDAALADAAARVRALCARRGHRAAEVTPRLDGDAQVAVALEVSPGPTTTVRGVALGAGEPFAGRLRTRPGAVLDEDALADDVRTLAAALHEAGYRRARVAPPEVRLDGAEAEVALKVAPGPRLTFAFRGNAAVPDTELARQLGLEPSQPVDAPAVDAAVDRLRAYYRARGFAAARIEPEETERGPGELAVVFHVDEGVPYRLGRVAIDGVPAEGEARVRARLFAFLDDEEGEVATPEADDTRALLASVPNAPPPRPPGALPARERLDEVAWDRAAERVVDGYRAEGWLEAIYLGSSAALDARRRVVDVTLRFREGALTRVESIAFEGNAAVPTPELARLLRVAPGDPLAYDRVEESRAALAALYASRGHAFARVETREELDRERHLAAIRFVVSEGPEVHVGQVVLIGNRRTQPDVVQDEIELRRGSRFEPEAVARSQAALLRLGVFRSVNLRLQDPDTPQAVKDLAVEVSERPHATLTQSFGYSIANGPRAELEFARPNLFGRAVELVARGKVNYLVDVGSFGPNLTGKSESERIEGRADVGLRSSRLRFLPLPTSVGADVIGEILHRSAYDLRRRSAVAGVDVGITSRIGASLQYEFEVDEISKPAYVGQLTQADVERLRFDQGVTTLQVVRPSFSLDFRDNAVHPHKGWYAAGAFEFEHSLGGPGDRVLGSVFPGSDYHTNLVKLSGTLSGYLPVGQESVLALSARGGRVIALDRRSRTIIPRRFFLGGATTMRGFGEEQMVEEDVRRGYADQGRACATSATGVGCTDTGRQVAAGKLPVSVGGEAFLLAKAELRLSITRSLETGLFLDVGNLWLNPYRFDLSALRPNAGIGLRLVTPVGPAAVDLGFNLKPDRAINESLYALHFTIGLF